MSERGPVPARLLKILAVFLFITAGGILLITPHPLRDSGIGGVPRPLEPPLGALAPLREAMLALMPVWFGVVLTLTMIGGALWILSGERWRAGPGLIATLGMLAAAVVLGIGGSEPAAAFMLVLGVILWGFWTRKHHREVTAAWGHWHIGREAEIALLLIIFLVAAWARLYELGFIPYGVQGDEAKWIVEIAATMLDENHVIASRLHFWGVPGAFYMQAPFHMLFGPSLHSARLATAVWSLFGALIFYALVREMFNAPVALIASFLLAVSPVDVAFSRLAIVENYLKPWTVLAPWLLLLALRDGRWWLFALAGGAFGFGIVTYDVFAPLYGVAALVTFAATARAFREKGRGIWAVWVIRWCAMIIPMLLFFGRGLMWMRGRSSEYRAGFGEDAIGELFARVRDIFATSIEQPLGDLIYNRDGPLINGLLVPFFILGFLWLLVRWRERRALLVVSWILLVFFPAPLLMGTIFPRAFYPALPALYIAAAAGLAVPVAWVRRRWSRKGILYAAGALVAAGFGLLSFYIYFNEVKDPGMRDYRQLSDLLLHNADDGRFTFVAYEPSKQWLYAENAVPWFDFYLRGRVERGAEPLYYALTPELDLLAGVSGALRAGDGPVAVIASMEWSHAERLAPVIEQLSECLPPRWVESLEHAIYMEFAQNSIEQSQCYGATLSLADWRDGALYGPGDPVAFRWKLSTGFPTDYALECKGTAPNAVYMEAESFTALNRFTPELRRDNGLLDGAGGTGAIRDVDEGGVAGADFAIAEAGRYAFWVRTLRMFRDESPLYLAIDDDEPAVFGLEHNLLTWKWERAAEVELEAGAHSFVISRRYVGGRPYPIYIDAVAVLPEDVEPGAIWSNAHDSGPIPLDHPGAVRGMIVWVPPEPGAYTCRLGLLDGERLVSLTKDSERDVIMGTWTDWLRFEVAESSERVEDG